MPDKKVATQASDGPWERETIITFNDAEKKASYYTCNKARMEQLKELAKEYPDAVKITRDGVCRQICPRNGSKSSRLAS